MSDREGATVLLTAQEWAGFLLRLLEQQGLAVLAILLVGVVLYERGLRPLKDGQVDLQAKTQALQDIVIRVLQRLAEQRVVKDEELVEFLRPLFTESAQRVVKLEEQRGNPLTPQELERLKHFHRKLESNEPFSVEEAKELEALARRVVAAWPGEPAAQTLEFLARLLSAVLVASEKRS